MDWRVYVLLAAGVLAVYLVRRFAKRRAAQQDIAAVMDEAARREPPKVSPPRGEKRDVAVVRPSLPAGRVDAIVAALRSGQEPDESWIGSGDKPSGGVKLLPYSAHYQSITGESFDNPDGVSRQSILRQAVVGSEVYLIPEPGNQYDSEAIAVYLDMGGGNVVQIGYLPRNNGIKGDVAANKVIAWLARVRARKAGAPLGAALYVVIDNS